MIGRLVPLGSRGSVAAIRLVVALGGIVASAACAHAQLRPLERLGPPIEVIGREFLRVVGVRALGDGRVLVSDVGDGSLLVVPAPGAKPDTVGRRGRGPGEYGRTGRLVGVGASKTLMEDTQYRRRYWIEGTRIVGTAHEVPRLAADFLLVGASADGRFFEVHPVIAGRDESGRPLPPLRRYAERLALIAFDGTGAQDTLARLRGGYLGRTTVRKVFRGQSMTYEFQSPLESEEQAVAFEDGWIAVLRSSPYRVDWIAPGRRGIRGEPLPFDSVRVDGAQRRRAIRNIHFAEYGEGLTPDDFPPWPLYLPPFLKDAFTALHDGQVSVRRAPDATIDGVIHDIVGRDGRLRQRLLLTANQRLVGSDRRGVFVVTRDEDGFEILSLHALRSRRD